MAAGLILVVAAGLLLASGGSRSKSSSKSNKSNSKRKPKECEGLSTQGGHLAGIDYLEIVTAGADPNARLPMIISLHGLGYDYTAHIKWLESLPVPARIILPNGFFEKTSSKKRAWWSSYSNKALQDASKGLAGFVHLIQQCRPTVAKPIITGHSMGGFVALDFAAQFPELISFSVPVAATRSSALWDIEPRVPVHGIHGKLDNSYNKGASYYYEMSERGLPVYLTTVNSGGHRIANANADAWRQVLSQIITG